MTKIMSQFCNNKTVPILSREAVVKSNMVLAMKDTLVNCGCLGNDHTVGSS